MKSAKRHPHFAVKEMNLLSRRVFLPLWFRVIAGCSLLIHFNSSAAETSNPFEVDVMSFNIRFGTARDGENHWRTRKELVVKIIEENQPDVVGLQEAHRFQVEEMLSTLPGYKETAQAPEDPQQYTLNAILYRAEKFSVEEFGWFWFSDTPEVISTSWGNYLPRTCNWARLLETESGRPFYFYNAHLDHLSQNSRYKSAGLILGRMAQREHPDPLVLTGDFNAGEENKAIEYLLADHADAGSASLRLVDSFRVLHPDEDEVGTYHAYSGKTDRDKIDYIFIQPEAEVLSSEIIHTRYDGKYPSDHFPLKSRIRFE